MCFTLTLYFSLPEELDFLSLSRLVMIGSVPLQPLSSPCMKSLKLGDQFFIKIYIFVQKKRHTYVIMANSEVTGCMYFCQGPSSAANYHLSLHGIEPSSRRQRAMAVRLRPCLLPLPVQHWESLSQGCSAVSLNRRRRKTGVPCVCSSCSLPFAVTDLAKLLPVCVLVAIIQVRNSQKRKYLFLSFLVSFQKIER